MGDVGDQDRRAVRVNADRPVQPWLLTSHERQEALQSGFVILGGGNRPIRTGLVSGLNYRDGRHESCRVQIRAAGAAHTRNFHGTRPVICRSSRIADSTRRIADARARSITLSSSARRVESAIPARQMTISSSLAEPTIRCRSAFRCSASVAVSAVLDESSAGQSPPITRVVQSSEELNVGIVRDSRVALGVAGAHSIDRRSPPGKRTGIIWPAQAVSGW